MKISTLKLYSANIREQKHFYLHTMAFPLLREWEDGFTVSIGGTRLSFLHRPDAKPYHFAINIPSNQENEALAWLQQRVEILPFEGEWLVDFPNWNAKAIYFYDADQNIVEFIARKNLQADSEARFSPESLMEVSEIGTPVKNIEAVFHFLNHHFSLEKYYGDFDIFGAIGDENGLFIVINNDKKDWFPVGDKAYDVDYEIVFSVDGQENKLTFTKGQFSTLQIN